MNQKQSWEEDCVFCDESKIKSEITHHNDMVMSFEPLNPVVPGHRIFVPKKHITDFFDDPKVFAEVSRVVSLCSRNNKEYNVITSKGKNATQSVMHLHVHLVPREENDGLMLPWDTKAIKQAIQTRERELREEWQKLETISKEVEIDNLAMQYELGREDREREISEEVRKLKILKQDSAEGSYFPLFVAGKTSDSCAKTYNNCLESVLSIINNKK